MKKYLSLLFATMALTAVSFAQSTTSGDISGTLTDPTGAVIPNAKVTVTNIATGDTKTVTTSGAGVYRVSLLQPGQYRVSASAANFTTTQNQVTVAIGTVSADDLKLAVGQGTTTVEVSSVPEAVNTENADITTTFTAQDVQAMPNPGNDLTFVAQTAPGSVMNTGTASGGYGNFSSFGISGLSNMFTLDGGYENDPFLNLNNTGASNLTLGNNEVDTVTTISPAFSAQFGGLGGAQVNEVTVGGVNRIHGNLSYYWDGRALNSNDWFNKQSEVFNGQKNLPTFVNANQWAARIGGPAIKDRLFWFVDTEGIRATTPNSGQVYVPNALLASCATGTQSDCNTLNIRAAQDCATNPNSTCVGDPVNGYALFAPAPASQLPLVTTIMNTYRKSPFRPAASSVHQDPNDVAAESYYTSSQSFLSEWLLTARVDYRISDKDNFFIHYKQDHGVQPTYTDLIDPRFNAYSPQPAWEGQMSEAHTFTPNLVNQLVLTGNYYSAPFQNTNNYLPVAPFTWIGINGDISNQYYGGIDYAFPQGRRVSGYQVIDDVSWTHGKNTIRVGYNFRRDNVTDLDQTRSVAPIAEGSEEGFSQGVLDYEWLQYFPVRSEQPISLYNQGAYIQDEYKVLPNLTLTAGVRIERNSNPTCHSNCFQVLANDVNSLTTSSSKPTASGDTPYSANFPGGYIQSGRQRAFTNYQKASIMPRLAANWSPTSKTVVRAGFGMFSDSFPGVVADSILSNPPSNFHAAVYGPVGGGAANLNLDPSTAGSGGTIARASNGAFQAGYASGGTYNTLRTAVAAAGGRFSAPNFITPAKSLKYPTYEEYSIAIEQRLNSKTSVSLTYAGNHGYHEPVQNGGRNLSNPGASATFFPQLFANNGTSKPVTAFGTITNVYSGASSNFNGIVVGAQHHEKGLTITFNYEYAHALDEVSNGGFEAFAPDAGNATTVANPYNLHAQYGNADYDVRQNTTGMFVWDMPNYLHKWAALTGGFEFTGVVFHQTGLPYSITASSSSLAGGSFANGSVNLYAHQLNNNFDHHCGSGAHALLPDGSNPNPCNFRTSGAFVEPTDFTQQHRNQLFGPSYSNVDFGAFKSFAMPHYEFLKLKLGAQFFNLFNHPNFQNPAHGISKSTSSAFGAIESTVGAPTSILGSVGGADATPRLIQLHGEITF